MMVTAAPLQKTTRNSPFFVTPETNVNDVAEKIGERKALIALYPVVNHIPFHRQPQQRRR